MKKGLLDYSLPPASSKQEITGVSQISYEFAAGGIIFLHVLWLVSWIITTVKYIKYRKNKKLIPGYSEPFKRHESQPALDFIMCFLWFFGIIVILGGK